ncbi:hypothetical protein BKC07_19140 [Peribacillus simplex]|nr:hypothetical protein BKC07_19140 [Peribacillus simplex]
MTKNKDENELLINGRLREELIGRIEVLDRVKGLLLLPNTEFATNKQVADFYNVDIEAINSVVRRNEVELSSDGFGLFNREDVLSLLNGRYDHLEKMR